MAQVNCTALESDFYSYSLLMQEAEEYVALAKQNLLVASDLSMNGLFQKMVFGGSIAIAVLAHQNAAKKFAKNASVYENNCYYPGGKPHYEYRPGPEEAQRVTSSR